MNPNKSIFFALALAFCATAHADKLKDHLSMFFSMESQDSVVALEQLSATSLKITVADLVTGKSRTLTEAVGAKPMQKLLIESNDLGLKTLHWSPPEDEAEAAPKAPASGGNTQVTQPSNPDGPLLKPDALGDGEKSRSARSISSPRKNRMWYIGSQTLLSTYVYGGSIPNAYDAGIRTRIAAPMIVAPFAFGANFYFAKNRTFEDSHRKGTSYLSIASLYASHALPFSLMDLDDNPYKVVSFLNMAVYPLGIWTGYKLGDVYIDQPGRIDTQQKFAMGFGILGFFTPFLYYENTDRNIESIIRLGLGQSVAFATAGHFLAEHYRTGENIPSGVNTGIMTHTALGIGLGLEVAALFNAETPRPWIAAALMGGTLGGMEGLFFYRKSYDSQERGLYNILGTGAGMLMGGGIAFLAWSSNDSDHRKKVLVTSLLVGGAVVGYSLTNLLTWDMEDRGAKRAESWTDRLAFNPLPLPEPAIRDNGVHGRANSGQEVYLRYRMPGLSYRF
ncbi:MAG: hypothetical protein M3Y08_03520 [Fibrobacterota bacterium]|nr:hypothetical protein [Fibrobacterota bacterium]